MFLGKSLAKIFDVLVQYLFYGKKELPDDVNRNLLELTLYFIHKRVGWDNFKIFVLRHTATIYVFHYFFCKSVSNLMLST